MPLCFEASEVNEEATLGDKERTNFLNVERETGKAGGDNGEKVKGRKNERERESER